MIEKMQPNLFGIQHCHHKAYQLSTFALFETEAMRLEANSLRIAWPQWQVRCFSLDWCVSCGVLGETFRTGGSIIIVQDLEKNNRFQ